jgi:DNA-binding Lrp family transcriptional regulator
MPKHSETVQAIQEVDKIEQVGELAVQGYQPTQIAEKLGISRMEVTRRMDKWLAERSTRLQEQAELVHLMEMSKLDYLYSQVAPYALPHYDEALKLMLPPDPKMLGVLVSLIKEKREWVKQVAARPTENKINIEHVEVTISQNNPLYSVAQANMEADYLSYADLDVSELYKPENTVQLLEKQTAELAEYVDLTDDGSEEERNEE